MDKIIDWGWAVLLGLVGLVWKLLHGRISATEAAVSKISERMDQQRDDFFDRLDRYRKEDKDDRHSVRDQLQASLTTQANTNLEVAKILGELKGRQ